MTQKRSTSDPTLENVPEKLCSAREIAPNIPNVILDFADFMADIAIKEPRYHFTFIAETLWILTCEAKNRIEGKQGGDGIAVPKKLEGKMPEVCSNIEYFYILIDKISSKEFSEKFRRLALIVNGK